MFPTLPTDIGLEPTFFAKIKEIQDPIVAKVFVGIVHSRWQYIITNQ